MAKLTLRRGMLPVALLLLVLVGTLAAPAGHTRAISGRPIIALYTTNLHMGDWSYDRMTELPAPLYESSDGDAMERHIQQASDVGVDVFLVQWDGPKDTVTEERIDRLRKRMERSNHTMEVSVLVNLSSTLDDGKISTRDGLLATIDKLQKDMIHQPGFLRFQGKPTIFWLNPNMYGDADAWRRLRNQVDIHREQFWFATTDIPNFQDNMPAYLDVFDAIFLYDITTAPQPTTAMSSYAGQVTQYNRTHSTQKPLIATVMPGYDDTRSNPTSGHARSREDGAYLRRSWDAAAQITPDAVFLNSFNDFYRGTQIETSEDYTFKYLDLSKELIGQFRARLPDPVVVHGNYFPQSGHYLQGVFRTYWESNGGAARFGFPITDEYVRSSDGKIVQYFEFVRMERSASGSQVDLGLLGREYLAHFGVSYPPVAAVATTASQRYFPETGHSISGAFKTHWDTQGGLGFFGYPISEQMGETMSDGVQRPVQYFERARLELQGSTVQQTRLGSALAPCQQVVRRAEGDPPSGPLPEGSSAACSGGGAMVVQPTPIPTSSGSSSTPDEPVAIRGRVYPSVVQPGTVQGFQAWNYAPGEVVSIWLNKPDGTVRELPYKAIADGSGYVLIGFQTEKTDPEGQWSLVGHGVTSGREFVGLFRLQW